MTTKIEYEKNIENYYLTLSKEELINWLIRSEKNKERILRWIDNKKKPFEFVKKNSETLLESYKIAKIEIASIEIEMMNINYSVKRKTEIKLAKQKLESWINRAEKYYLKNDKKKLNEMTEQYNRLKQKLYWEEEAILKYKKRIEELNKS